MQIIGNKVFGITRWRRVVFAAACISWNLSAFGQQTQEHPPATSQPARGPTVTVQQPDVPKPTIELKPGEVPRIKFESTVHEFPRTPQGHEARHDFTFTNAGNGPLEILTIRASCGCTTSGGYDKIIQPGGKGRIPIVVQTKDFVGYINKSVTVLTNSPEPDSAAVNLSMRGDVWEPVTIVPKTVGFGRLAVQSIGDQPPMQKVTITNQSPTKAELTGLRSSSPSFKGELKVVEPGKVFELEVTLVPPYQGGVFSGNFEMETGIAERPKIDIPVSVYYSAEIEVFPTRLPIPAHRANDLKRQFLINNNGEKPVHLTEVTSTHKDLKAQIEETRPGMAYKVLLEIPKSYRVRPGGDVLMVKTDSRTTPMISIPIVEARLSGPVSGAPIPIGNPSDNEPKSSLVPVTPEN